MFALARKARTGKSDNLKICCVDLILESSGTKEHGAMAAKFSNQLCQAFSNRAKTAMSARYQLAIETIKIIEAWPHEGAERIFWNIREVIRPSIQNFRVWKFPQT